MSDRQAIINRVTALVQDVSAKLSPADLDSCITAALGRYSKHRPDEKAVDITGTGVHDYALPAGWVEGFSEIEQIEYPVDQVPAELLDEDDYEVYRAVAGRKIRLITYAPSATFRVTFSIPRTDATVPDGDVDAFAMLAASLCLEVLSTRYVDTSDPTIAADVVNYRSKSSEAAARAKQYAKLYKEHIGMKEEDGVPAASAVVSNELSYPGGGDRLTHPRRLRRLR